MSWKWWIKFPRKIGSPNQVVCQTPEHFVDLYNRMNGMVDKLYMSIYACDPFGHRNTVVLDVFSYDIDDIDRPEQFQVMLDLHNKLLQLNWRHQVLFSTKGAWIFVQTQAREYTQSVAKGKLAAMQDSLLEGTPYKFGKPHEAPLDISIRGDTERICRMPSSYDRTRDRYCLFLTQEDINAGYNHITEISTKATPERRYAVYDFGEVIGVDPEDVIAKAVQSRVIMSEFSEDEYVEATPTDLTTESQKMLAMLPEFMRQWLLNPERGTWRARFYLTLYLRERGFPQAQTERFLKPFLEDMPRTDHWKNNWEHYIHAAQCSDHVYRRKDLKFPNYQGLYEEGLCPYSYVERYGAFNSPAYRPAHSTDKS